MSYAYHGSYHDLTILRTELQSEKGTWFDNITVHVDLGFQGIIEGYKFGKLSIPIKKKPKKELLEIEKMINKTRSSIRVLVENSIAGFKRYRFLSDRLRCRNMTLYNKVAGICAGIWNFCLTH